MSKLVITNGDSAAALLVEAGLAGDALLPWRDALHEGPVIDDGDLAALSRQRATFLAAAFSTGQDQQTVEDQFAERDALFLRHNAFEEVELWFEHDLYDQLQLLQILTLLDRAGRYRGVRLIQASDHLGHETPKTVCRIERLAFTLPRKAFAFANQVWTAFSAGTPEDLVQAIANGNDTLVYVRPAILRLLAELPDTVAGLSQTERMILERLHVLGPLRAGPLFKAYSETEPAAFHGDLSFFAQLDRLKNGEFPLVAGPVGRYQEIEWTAGDRLSGPYLETPFALTDAGLAVVTGRKSDHAPSIQPYWIGNTQITDETPWRWDRARKTLTFR
ncbi:MAG: DUF1835 domain-containing protein [Pseudomonadota bacterium]